MTDFPSGDGHPKCPECKGRGVIDYKPPGAIVPGALACKCVKLRDYRLNMERGWRGLSKYKPVKRSPLADQVEENLRITSSEKTLRRHLARVALGQAPRWPFFVFSDADLMDAWLSRVDVEEILDPDIGQLRRTAVSGRFGALVDLVDPPALLILRMGVKAARNVAMPEVFLEALQHRSMIDKPTWVVDTPAYVLKDGHIAYDFRVGEYLSEWPHIDLGTGQAKEVDVTVSPTSSNGGVRRMTLSQVREGSE